jgi:hypothetical protein
LGFRRTADPSTSLRFGRDDNLWLVLPWRVVGGVGGGFVWGVGAAQIPPLRYASVGMTICGWCFHGVWLPVEVELLFGRGAHHGRPGQVGHPPIGSGKVHSSLNLPPPERDKNGRS